MREAPPEVVQSTQLTLAAKLLADSLVAFVLSDRDLKSLIDQCPWSLEPVHVDVLRSLLLNSERGSP